MPKLSEIRDMDRAAYDQIVKNNRIFRSYVAMIVENEIDFPPEVKLDMIRDRLNEFRKIEKNL